MHVLVNIQRPGFALTTWNSIYSRGASKQLLRAWKWCQPHFWWNFWRRWGRLGLDEMRWDVWYDTRGKINPTCWGWSWVGSGQNKLYWSACFREYAFSNTLREVDLASLTFGWSHEVPAVDLDCASSNATGRFLTSRTLESSSTRAWRSSKMAGLTMPYRSAMMIVVDKSFRGSLLSQDAVGRNTEISCLRYHVQYSG